MNISSEFQENVKSGDLIIVRSTLLDYLIIDKTFRKFDDALKYALNANLKIIEKYDGEPIEKDPEKWTRDYLDKQKVALIFNFSEERITHIKAVISKVLQESTQEQFRGSNIYSKAVPKSSRTDRKIIGSEETSKNSRTGRRIIGSEETPKNSRTGRKTIGSEAILQSTTTDCKSVDKNLHCIEKQKNSNNFDVGTTLIVVGGVMLTVGVIALGIIAAEAVATGTGVIAAKSCIGTGAVMAGTGGVKKVKNKI